LTDYLAKINKAYQHHKARRGRLAGLFGSLGFPHQRLLAESIKWVCMKEDRVWGNKLVIERLIAAIGDHF